MNSHDARRQSCNHSCNSSSSTRRKRRSCGGSFSSTSSSSSSFLLLLATALCANNALMAVDAFGVPSLLKPAATRSTSSSSKLDISTTIPYCPPQTHSAPSLADMMEEMGAAISQKKNNHKKKKRPAPLEEELPTSTLVTSEDNLLVLDEQEVVRRKLEWAGRYTTVEALRETFGSNQNKLWGDLQASTARRLYKTLLPRALLELSQLGVGQLQPQDLAPLAYQARVAAKLYARERCTVPARIGATLFDGFRQWIKYGKFQAHGMTYDQLWEKYSEKICNETESGSCTPEETVCLKILERSCVSNAGVDKLVLKNAMTTPPSSSSTEASNIPSSPVDANTAKHIAEQQELLERIHAQLEQDMFQLLLPKNVVVSSPTSPSTSKKRNRPWSKRNHVMMVRLLARQRRLMQHRQQQLQADQDIADILRP